MYVDEYFTNKALYYCTLAILKHKESRTMETFTKQNQFHADCYHEIFDVMLRSKLTKASEVLRFKLWDEKLLEDTLPCQWLKPSSLVEPRLKTNIFSIKAGNTFNKKRWMLDEKYFGRNMKEKTGSNFKVLVERKAVWKTRERSTMVLIKTYRWEKQKNLDKCDENAPDGRPKRQLLRFE